MEFYITLPWFGWNLQYYKEKGLYLIGTMGFLYYSLIVIIIIEDNDDIKYWSSYYWVVM